MTTAIHRLVAACRAGTLPQLITPMASGWAVMGAQQVLEGYSLLLPDPVVPHLNALDGSAREQFMSDLARLGDAVLKATGALRINYAIFGNLEPALHAHVHPRYENEPPPMRTGNPWAYDWSIAAPFDAVAHGDLRARILRCLAGTMPVDAPGKSVARLHHIDLTVADLARSTVFYDRWLTAMGFARIQDVPEGPLWRGARFELGLQQARPAETSRPHSRWAVGLHHLAFAADSKIAVMRLYEELRAAGVAILDPPVAYEHYAPGYFAVFFADPDGIKLEYVFTPA